MSYARWHRMAPHSLHTQSMIARRVHCIPLGQGFFGQRMETPDLSPARGDSENRPPGFAITVRAS